MNDPLTQIMTMLQPKTVFSKGICGAGAWSVQYSEFGEPSFCVVLEGRCLLSLVGQESRVLEAGDFVLLPKTPGFTLSSIEGSEPKIVDSRQAAMDNESIQHGRTDIPPDVRLLGGYFSFGARDAGLLVSLLPPIVHVSRHMPLEALVKMVRQESMSQLPGKELILTRLVELLLIESIRMLPDSNAPAGLIKGLSDDRIANALRLIHGSPSHPWTMAKLAEASALSRTVFFKRFSQLLGRPPMAYLLSWRMALAKQFLREKRLSLDEIAERVGYGSASAFSTAFKKFVGTSPGLFAKAA